MVFEVTVTLSSGREVLSKEELEPDARVAELRRRVQRSLRQLKLRVCLSALVDPDGKEVVEDHTAVGHRLTSGSTLTAICEGLPEVCSSHNAFAAVTGRGAVTTWGLAAWGGDLGPNQASLQSDVRRVYATVAAFAALKTDGTVVTWGDPDWGGRPASEAELSGVVDIFATSSAFAALRDDGSVVTWGNSDAGGDSSAVQHMLTGVLWLYPSAGAFVAVNGAGRFVCWGNLPGCSHGAGGEDSRAAALAAGQSLQACSTQRAIAVQDADGSVIAWGDPTQGGKIPADVERKLASGVVQLCATRSAIAAVLSDGTVCSWGNNEAGGGVYIDTEDVAHLFSTSTAFAALTHDGSVVAWGDPENGGEISSKAAELSGDVSWIYSNCRAFAALKTSGSVRTWGSSSAGGAAPPHVECNQIRSISSTHEAFAAITARGSVVAWGNDDDGGDLEMVEQDLTEDVEEIVGGAAAFVAVKCDGSLVAWGDPWRGGVLDPDELFAAAAAALP